MSRRAHFAYIGFMPNPAAKIASLFNSLRLEEKFLIMISLIFFGVFLIIKPDSIDFSRFVELQLSAFKNSFSWFFGTVALLWAYFLCFYTLKFLIKTAFCKDRNREMQEAAKAKVFFWETLRYFRFFILLILGFSGELLVLYAITMSGHERMVNGMIMEWDKTVFGVYPFLWFHTLQNPLKPVFDFLAPLILFSFDKLSLIMGVSVVLLFSKKTIFAGLVMSYFIAAAISLFIWNIFPVNSPNNYFLAKNQNIEGYFPNDTADKFQAEIREKQKNTLPISTFPSAHVMWGLETVYFWALYKRKTLFVSAPWFLLMALGTVYFAQHWAVDILAAIPIAILSIAIADIISRKFAKDRIAK